MMSLSMVITIDLLNDLYTIIVSHILLSPFKKFLSLRRKKDSGLMTPRLKSLLYFIRQKQLVSRILK